MLCLIFLMLSFSLLPDKKIINLPKQRNFSHSIKAMLASQTQGMKEIVTLTYFQIVPYIFQYYK